MANTLTNDNKITIWQSLRASIGLWDAARITISTAGTTLIFTTYTILLINQENLDKNIATAICLILFLISLGLCFLVSRFSYSIEKAVIATKSIETSLFGKDKEIKISSILSDKKASSMPFLYSYYYHIWGIGLITFSALLTVCQFLS